MSPIQEPALRLPDGSVVKLPTTPEYLEFALPGNARHFPAAGFWAFHDTQTNTGAIYYAAHGTWAIQQPVEAISFWAHCTILGCTDIGKASSESIAQELSELLATGAGPRH